MSLWEFSAAIGGYAKANSSPDEAAITTTEAEALSAFLDEPPVWTMH